LCPSREPTTKDTKIHERREEPVQLAASSFFSSFFLLKYQSFTSRPLLEATRFSASA
jgi:hypothetical protein